MSDFARSNPEACQATRVEAIVLAAGLSRRAGETNKLLAPVDGAPMILRVVQAALASAASGVVVVTGHESGRIETTLADESVRFVQNDEYESGLASSLRAGIRALEPKVDGALICLGDMPWVGSDVMDALIRGFEPERGSAVCVPTCDGERGNPVLWGAAFFEEIEGLDGDAGARCLLEEHGDRVRHITVGDRGIFRDLDTAADLNRHTDGDRRVITQD